MEHFIHRINILLVLSCFTWDVLCFTCQSMCRECDESMINVHLIPHSHMDLSWIKTFDQYYWGTGSTRENVQAIFNSVIDAVDDDTSRRFIFVETAFIWMWFTHHSDKMKKKLINLVNSGQIEIVSGGWSMNDEACTNYQAIIDQMTLGHQSLIKMMGECAKPKVAWQIDPFGHSREFAHLASQMQLDALFIHRVHFDDIIERQISHEMLLKWKTSDELSSEMFTVILPYEYGYSSPPGLRREEIENNPIVTDQQSPEYNSQEIVGQVINVILDLVNIYNQSNILIPIGSDFSYKNAHEAFEFYDDLIKQINSVNEDKINVFYSTPSCYVKNLKREKNVNLVEKTGDFFPYTSSPDEVWTGYFTSRQSTKLAERIGNNLLQSCKYLQVAANLRSPEDDERVAQLARVVALMQHHDAIAGTSTESVDNDYHVKLEEAVASCAEVAHDAFTALLDLPSSFNVTVCHQLNDSLCNSTTQSNNFTLVIVNPLGWSVNNHLVSLPWTHDSVKVVDVNGDEVTHQVVATLDTFITDVMKHAGVFNHLEFMVPLLPPTSISVFHVTTSRGNKNPSRVFQFSPQDDLIILSASQQIHFNKFGQLMKLVLHDNTVVKLTQHFALYHGFDQFDERHRQSDAYLFYPDGQAEAVNRVKSVTVVQTNDYTEVRQSIDENISQCIRVNRYDDLIEFHYRVSSSNCSTSQQIITRYSSDLQTKSTFFTDANGRQMMKRTRNLYQNTVAFYLDTNHVSSNYYPVTSRIIVRDEERDLQMTVFTDRSQGGSSLLDGQVELMLHSTSPIADNLGMGEPLKDTDVNGKKIVLKGKHRLLIASIANSTVHREIAVKLQQSPSYYFITPTKQVKQQSFLIYLPSNVRLLSFEASGNQSTLVRLEHIYQKHDAVDKASPVQINLSQMFSSIGPIDSIKEVTLTGCDMKSAEIERNNENIVITLEPMMIKSFIIDFELFTKSQR